MVDSALADHGGTGDQLELSGDAQQEAELKKRARGCTRVLVVWSQRRTDPVEVALGRDAERYESDLDAGSCRRRG
jgi:hypothetical protein